MLFQRIMATIIIILVIINFTKISTLINELTSKKNFETDNINEDYEIWIGDILENNIKKGFIISEKIFNIEKNTLFYMKNTKNYIKNGALKIKFNSYNNEYIIKNISSKYDLLTDNNKIIINEKNSDYERNKYLFDTINKSNILYKEFKYNESTHKKYKILFGNKKYNKNLVYSELIDIIKDNQK